MKKQLRPRYRWDDGVNEMEWVHLSLHRIQWRTIVYVVLNHRFHQRPKLLDSLSDCQFHKKNPVSWSQSHYLTPLLCSGSYFPPNDLWKCPSLESNENIKKENIINSLKVHSPRGKSREPIDYSNNLGPPPECKLQVLLRKCVLSVGGLKLRFFLSAVYSSCVISCPHKFVLALEWIIS